MANASGYTSSYGLLPKCAEINNPWQSYADAVYKVGIQISNIVQSGGVVPGSLNQAFDSAMQAYDNVAGPCL